MCKYKIYGLDVWGNEEDGFDVNDRWQVGTIELQEPWDGSDIFKKLYEKGMFKPFVTECDVKIDISDEHMIFVESVNDGCPIFQLEIEE